MANPDFDQILCLSNRNFQRFLLTTNDPGILSGLQCGFPHLFKKGNFRIGVRTLKRLSRDVEHLFPRKNPLEYEAAYPLSLSRNRIIIPKMRDLRLMYHRGLPSEVLSQLNGQRAKMGLRVSWIGQTFFVLDLQPTWRNDFERGETLEVRPSDELFLLHIECVDLQS